jgi:hypothetical protein
MSICNMPHPLSLLHLLHPPVSSHLLLYCRRLRRRLKRSFLFDPSFVAVVGQCSSPFSVSFLRSLAFASGLRVVSFTYACIHYLAYVTAITFLMHTSRDSNSGLRRRSAFRNLTDDAQAPIAAYEGSRLQDHIRIDPLGFLGPGGRIILSESFHSLEEVYGDRFRLRIAQEVLTVISRRPRRLSSLDAHFSKGRRIQSSTMVKQTANLSYPTPKEQQALVILSEQSQDYSTSNPPQSPTKQTQTLIAPQHTQKHKVGPDLLVFA